MSLRVEWHCVNCGSLCGILKWRVLRCGGESEFRVAMYLCVGLVVADSSLWVCAVWAVCALTSELAGEADLVGGELKLRDRCSWEPQLLHGVGAGAGDLAGECLWYRGRVAPTLTAGS